MPTDDPELARIIFQSFIELEMMILMVILGDTETIRQALPKADNLATLMDHNMQRWVIWVRNPIILKDEFERRLTASESENADAPYDEIKCFCFSPLNDLASGVILKNGTLSYSSLNRSFFKAHLHDISNP